MQKILIIGKNSFLAKNFILYCRKKIIFKAISHRDFKKEDFKKYSYIINFAICNKKYRKSNIDDKYNFDLILAKKIISEKSYATYVFLSSRKVYKADKNIKETSTLGPIDIYGANKLKTEKKIMSFLNFKYLILRVSNVIGIPKKKKTNNFIDNYFSYKKKNMKNIKVSNDFKDFITVDDFSKSLFLLIKKKSSGVFNISLGKKIYIKDLLYWLNEKFYKNFIFESTNLTTSFYLNNFKLTKKINFKPSLSGLKKYVKNNLKNKKY